MKTVLHFFASAWENFFGRTRLAGLALSLALVVPAGAGIEGSLFYQVVENEITITDCATAASGALEIPATIEDEGGDVYPVTSIGDYAFSGCSSLTSITIGDGVASIGGYAFFGCSSLTSITIPDSVTSIGSQAFAYCTSLTAVTFLGDAPKAGGQVFIVATPTIYRKPEAKGWGDTFAGRPVELISEKP